MTTRYLCGVPEPAGPADRSSKIGTGRAHCWSSSVAVSWAPCWSGKCLATATGTSSLFIWTCLQDTTSNPPRRGAAHDHAGWRTRKPIRKSPAPLLMSGPVGHVSCWCSRPSIPIRIARSSLPIPNPVTRCRRPLSGHGSFIAESLPEAEGRVKRMWTTGPEPGFLEVRLLRPGRELSFQQGTRPHRSDSGDARDHRYPQQLGKHDRQGRSCRRPGTGATHRNIVPGNRQFPAGAYRWHSCHGLSRGRSGDSNRVAVAGT